MKSDDDTSFEMPSSKQDLEKLALRQHQELTTAFGKLHGMEPLCRNYPKLLAEIQDFHDFLRYLEGLFDNEVNLDKKKVAESVRKFCAKKKKAADALHFKIQDVSESTLAERMDYDVVRRPEPNLLPALELMTARADELAAQLRAKTEEVDRLRAAVQRGGSGGYSQASFEERIKRSDEEAAVAKRQLVEINAKLRAEQERAIQLDQQVATLRENDEKKNRRFDELLLAASQHKEDIQIKYMETVTRLQTSENKKAQAERNVEYYQTRIHELETQLAASKRAAVDQREVQILQDQIAALSTQNQINKQDFAEERQEKERIFREKLNVQQEMLKLRDENARLKQQVNEWRPSYPK